MNEIARLRRERPRSRFARFTVIALLALVVYAWYSGEFDAGRLFSFVGLLAGALYAACGGAFDTASVLTERTARNLDRFLGELRPHPLHGKDWDWGVAWDWVGDILHARGFEAILATLAISVAAIVLAGIVGGLLAMPAARSVATPEPFLPGARRPSPRTRRSWRALMALVRFGLVFFRAIPEFVWAFILLGLLGPGAWPAVLALAIHNAGILGKLNAEVIENLEPASLKAMRGLGGSRAQIGFVAILPASLGRFLLYFFYRWETCVREATVLGLLGIVSLGYWIQDARARTHYDTMFLFILFGALLILLGDIVSALARRAVRRAS